MAVLKFDLGEVRALCEHAMASTDWSTGYETDQTPRPGLMLVGDQGVYLMSNGKPGLRRADDKGHVVAYAEGINPNVDDFDTWWNTKRATFGADDGVEVIPWCEPILKLAAQKPDAKCVMIGIIGDQVELWGVE